MHQVLTLGCMSKIKVLFDAYDARQGLETLYEYSFWGSWNVCLNI